MSEIDAFALQAAADLTPSQQTLFYNTYRHEAKSYTVALLLAIFTGWWLGGHNFYLGRMRGGFLHILLAIFSAGIVSTILTIIDIINLHEIVNKTNARIATDIVARIRALGSSQLMPSDRASLQS